MGDQSLCEACRETAVIADRGDKGLLLMYCAQPYQRPWHTAETKHLLELGTRGTGKSTWLRWDAILRCLKFPGFKALIIRRQMGDLRKSHLQFVGAEIAMLAVGHYREGTFDVKFDNGSILQFSHCEKMSDISDYLSSQWDYVGFDELSTFPLEMFLTIAAAARTPKGKPYRALIRCCSNPLGAGAGWMYAWFVDKTVNLSDYPDYNPLLYDHHFSTFEQNQFLDHREYRQQLAVLPDHYRKAWLDGERVIEGAFFTDFQKSKDVVMSTGVSRTKEWHVVTTLPTWDNPMTGERMLIAKAPWIRILRSLDWGYWPDPAVCHWHVLMPNKQKITFLEREWKRTLAPDVAKDIKRLSTGMQIVETWADPKLFVKDGSAPFSLAEQFERNGVPLTPAQNDRALYGYALNYGLKTLVHAMTGCSEVDCSPESCAEHWVPLWQIYKQGCPELIRTLPLLQTDPLDPAKLANGPDHWAVSCAYAWMSDNGPSFEKGPGASFTAWAKQQYRA